MKKNHFIEKKNFGTIKKKKTTESGKKVEKKKEEKKEERGTDSVGRSRSASSLAKSITSKASSSKQKWKTILEKNKILLQRAWTSKDPKKEYADKVIKILKGVR